MTTPHKPPHRADFSVRIAALQSQLPKVDAAVAAAQLALDAALLAGQDSRPFHGALRLARASRLHAERAIENVIASQKDAERQRHADAAAPIDAATAKATADLVARYDFTIEGLPA